MSLAVVSADLSSSIDEIVDRLYARLVAEIAPLRRLDSRLRTLLRASTHANVEAGIDLVAGRIETAEVRAPAAATLLARRLAQHDVPLSAVLRAYRLGQADFLQFVMGLVADRSPRAYSEEVLPLVARISAYVDRVCEEVSDVYEVERDRWASRRGAIRGQRVRQILDSRVRDVDEAEAVMQYRLAGRHLAAVAWADADEDHDDLTDVEGLADRLTAAMGGGDHLAVPVDDRELWLWVRVPDGVGSPRSEELSAVVDPGSDTHLAIGTPHRDVDGFRESHREAQLTKGVSMRARGREDRVTAFAEVGPIALLSRDADALRAWVGQVLGPLAAEGERETWLRDSLRVFLECDGSHAAASGRLQLHRNTIQYRVRKAEELRGRPVGHERLQVHLALTAIRWLGGAVIHRSA